METPTEGIVASWNDEESWGSIESASTPGGCWFFATELMIQGSLASLSPGESVNFTFEQLPSCLQDGYGYRAIEVWRPSGKVQRMFTGPKVYESHLEITYEDNV